MTRAVREALHGAHGQSSWTRGPRTLDIKIPGALATTPVLPWGTAPGFPCRCPSSKQLCVALGCPDEGGGVELRFNGGGHRRDPASSFFMLSQHHPQRAASLRHSGFGHGREQQTLFFAVVAFVCKLLEKTDKGGQIARIDRAGGLQFAVDVGKKVQRGQNCFVIMKQILNGSTHGSGLFLGCNTRFVWLTSKASGRSYKAANPGNRMPASTRPCAGVSTGCGWPTGRRAWLRLAQVFCDPFRLRSWSRLHHTHINQGVLHETPLLRQVPAVAAVALGAVGVASAAHAGTDVIFSIGLNAPYGYVQPQPVYVEPQPVYVQPRRCTRSRRSCTTAMTAAGAQRPLRRLGR